MHRKEVIVLFDKNKSDEFRSVEFRTEARETETGKKELVVRGYPILFNTPTKVWDSWYGEIEEIILPQAMDGVDLRNVFLLYGHDMNRVFGRTGKNLRLDVDETGLFMECVMPNTQEARDAYNLIEAGIVDGMSFWLRTHDQVNPATLTRTVTKIEELPEITITAFPAYKETVVITVEEVKRQERLAQERMARRVEEELKKFK